MWRADRPGKATANDVVDHITVLTDALAQLPAEQRARVLVRGDSGAGVQAFVRHLHELGVHYSVGLYARQPIVDASPHCPGRPGDPRSTPTVSPVPAPRSPSLPVTCAPVTFLAASVIEVPGRRVRHDCVPLSLMIRGVVSPGSVASVDR